MENGHIISNLRIDTLKINNNYLGLFGQALGVNVEITNLGIEYCKIIAGPNSQYIGSLCGKMGSLRGITNCYATGTVTGLFCW